MIDGELKEKTRSVKGNAASWTESFNLWVYLKISIYHDIPTSCGSEAIGSSVLECRVYAKHKIGNDDFIGGTKDTIESLLAEGAAGGLYILILDTFC